VVTAAILAVASVAFAQKADFSGTWTLDQAASGGEGSGRGGRGGLGPGPATVKQTGDTLTIEREMGGNKVVTTYKLDGSESKNAMFVRGGQQMESVSTAKWDGAKLVITSKSEMGESTQTWSLAGDALTIETSNARGTQKRVYKKTT
jgi:hypothetical protein